MPKICLNMILKNESKVIIRLLTSVLPIIDSYCICDTGSTDNTIELIEQFGKENNLPGNIIREPFKDFGYNRTYSLNACFGLENADYLLLLDADMILEFGSGFSIDDFKNELRQDVYYVLQGSDQMYYKNVRLVKNIEDMYYWGVTHEYLSLPENHTTNTISKQHLFINDVGDGGAKQDKFTRDIRLLKNGLIENPNNDRYTFYLANSYKDTKQYALAIETYKKRVALDGWKQEVWYSYYNMGLCYCGLNDYPNALFYWLEAYSILPERIENLYQIICYYRKKGQHSLAYHYYQLADYQRTKHTSTDHLFYHKDIYDFKLDYEFSIIGFYSNNMKNNIYDSCNKVLTSYSSDNIKNNVLQNYKYYAKQLSSMKQNNNQVLLLNKNICEVDIDLNNFYSSTPSICSNNSNTKLFVNTRYVNYFINPDGRYTNCENIITKNVTSVFRIEDCGLTKEEEFELGYNENLDNYYIGMEDIRLLYHNNELVYNANRVLPDQTIRIETGKINISETAVGYSNIVQKTNINPVEKNWVLFTDNKNELKVIYNWFPITIGSYVSDNDKTQFEDTHNIYTPSFFKNVRGSTNGVVIGNEIWFICHIVSYENRSFYYHMFVVLDRETYKLKNYSQLFTFEREPIEYTLGFVLLNDNFLVGYSTNDRTTKYINVKKNDIEELFMM